MYFKKNQHNVTPCNFDMWQPHNSQEEKKKKDKTKKPPQPTHITVFSSVPSISSSKPLYHFRINDQGLSNVSSQIPAKLLLSESK